MGRTIRRQPFTVSTSGYTKDSVFTQVDFKGLCTNKNDITTEMTTFADVNNVYLDENAQLVSRPPFKFEDGEAYIIDQWMLGDYGLRLYRLLGTETSGVFEQVSTVTEENKDELLFKFVLSCITHEVSNEPSFTVSVNAMGWDFVPKITLAQIEEKIFVWFAGVNLFVLNTIKNSFEDASKFLYLPVHKLVINGIESEFETKNYLTDAYIRRHQYSALSSVNFEKLVDTYVSVGLNSGVTQNTSRHLYNINIQENQEKMLIYPQAFIGNNYHIDVVQGGGVNVMLRYSIALHTIEISFNAKNFRRLPYLEDILGEPMLTRDGLYAVAFTKTGIAQCKLTVQSTQDTEDDLFVWIVRPYLEYHLQDGVYIDTNIIPSFIPSGYFETIDRFAYVIKASAGQFGFEEGHYLYTEYLGGMNGKRWGCIKLEESDNSDTLLSDDIKVYAKYIAPTFENSEVRMVVSIIARATSVPNSDTITIVWSKNCVLNYYLTEKSESVDRTLREGDVIKICDANNEIAFEKYIYKLDMSTETIINENSEISPGDTVVCMDNPLSYYDAPSYVNGLAYGRGDVVKYPSSYAEGMQYIYECTKVTTSVPGSNDWKLLEKAYSFIEYSGATSIYVPKREGLSLKNRYTISAVGIGNVCELKGVSVSYTPSEFDTKIGYVYSFHKDTDGNPSGIARLYSNLFSESYTYSNTNSYKGHIYISDVENPVVLKRRRYHGLGTSTEDVSHLMRYADISIEAIIGEDVYFNTFVAYNIVNTATGEYRDSYRKIVYNHKTNESHHEITHVSNKSSYFKIASGTENVLTDLYAYINKRVCPKPDIDYTGFVTEKERIISNGDTLSLFTADMTDIVITRNIYKVDTTDWLLTSGVIESGDVVSYVEGATTEKEYLRPVPMYASSYISNFYYIQKLDSEENVISGPIHIGDKVKLVKYNQTITLPVGHPGNPTSETIYVGVAGLGYSGKAYVSKRVQPLFFDDASVWYNIEGMLWTSALSTDTIIELDEYVNCDIIDDKPTFSMNLTPPDFHKTLNEQYFVYNTSSGSSLQVSLTKRNEEKLYLNEEPDFLLYLPKRNEQKFTNRITNLHPLSDTEMGIFTESELWYISTVVGEDGTVSYTKPILSKTPAGCRYGSDVITSFDGQALIFTTPRGISVLAPQNFIATTEKTLSYSSDTIQEEYDKFYHENVSNAARIPNEFENLYEPQIKIKTYKYWILFHKYMDRKILAFDTRNSSWWIWTTPYPIRSLTVGSRLHVLMQIDFSPIQEGEIILPVRKASFMGVSFIFADRECNIVMKDDTFPELKDTPITNIGYFDDTVDGALNGLSELIYENEFIGYRRKLHYASPTINWHFTSQKLHFNQINNYKAIKALNINVRGNETFSAKISTKAFRDLYHPEQDSVIRFKVKDLRTFIKHFNLLHVMDFQYKLENDAESMEVSQLRLNGLNIKYEIKEGIR